MRADANRLIIPHPTVFHPDAQTQALRIDENFRSLNNWANSFVTEVVATLDDLQDQIDAL